MFLQVWHLVCGIRYAAYGTGLVNCTINPKLSYNVLYRHICYQKFKNLTEILIKCIAYMKDFVILCFYSERYLAYSIWQQHPAKIKLYIINYTVSICEACGMQYTACRIQQNRFLLDFCRMPDAKIIKRTLVCLIFNISQPCIWHIWYQIFQNFIQNTMRSIIYMIFSYL